MVDVKKVCKGLKCHMKKGICGKDCPYEAPGNCSEQLCADALALIRQQQARIAELEAAQEPIPPVVEQEMDDVCSCIDDVYRCGKCWCRLGRFAEKNKYCPDCGKAVKWDD